jgi:hypothetical protein
MNVGQYVLIGFILTAYFHLFDFKLFSRYAGRYSAIEMLSSHPAESVAPVTGRFGSVRARFNTLCDRRAPRPLTFSETTSSLRFFLGNFSNRAHRAHG